MSPSLPSPLRAAALLALVAACGKEPAAAIAVPADPAAPATGSGAAAARTVTGRASAGPVAGAAVDVYLVSNIGTYARALGSGVTDASGVFAVDVDADPNAFLAVEVHDGTYLEEADGAPVPLSQGMRLLVAAGQSADCGVTPLTEIATQRALAQLQASVSLQAAMADASFAMAAAAGLDDVTRAPADPNQPVADPNGQNAKYALVLAGISELARLSATTSVALTDVLGAHFSAHGSLDVGPDATPVNLTTQAGAALSVMGTSWSAGVANGIASFLAARGAHIGLTLSSLTVLDASPPLARPAP